MTAVGALLSIVLSSMVFSRVQFLSPRCPSHVSKVSHTKMSAARTEGDGAQLPGDDAGVPQPPVVDPPIAASMHKWFLDSMVSQGFSENAVKKAVINGCGENEDACLQWLAMHLDFPGLNDPLPPHWTVDVVALSPEMVAQKVAEMKARIKARKEAEEAAAKVNDAKDYKARMEAGKYALEAKREREKQLQEKTIDDRRREQEADRKAKEKVTFDLAVDKLVRQGVSRDAAVVQVTADREAMKQQIRLEQKQRQQQTAVPRAAAAAGSGAAASSGTAAPWNIAAVVASGGASVGMGSISSSRQNLQRLTQPEADVAASGPPDRATFERVASEIQSWSSADAASKNRCLGLLKQIINTVLANPFSEKGRCLNVSGSAFGSILAVPPAASFLRALGFQLSEAGDKFVLHMLVVPRLAEALDVLQTME